MTDLKQTLTDIAKAIVDNPDDTRLLHSWDFPGKSTGVGCPRLLGRKTVWRFLKKLGIRPPYDPAIPLLGIYTKETKIEEDTCIPLFTAALFTIARTWKQPRCPSKDE